MEKKKNKHTYRQDKHLHTDAMFLSGKQLL